MPSSKPHAKLLVSVLMMLFSVAVSAPVSAAGAHPTVTPVTSSSLTLSYHGGAVMTEATLTNAATCLFTVTPTVRGGARRIACTSGTVRDRVVIPPNTLKVKRAYTIRLTVSGSGGSVSTVLRRVMVAAEGSVATAAITISVPAGPDAFVQAGSDIWVASCQGNAVTEINKNTKQIIMTLTNASNPSNLSYGFSCPDAITFDGTHIWVANSRGNSLTQLNESTGALIQIITASDIAAPIALAFDGTHIWVGNSNGSSSVHSLVAFDASSGNVLNTYNNTRFQYPLNPTCIAFTGTNLWVSDSNGATAFEYSLTGRYLRTTSSAAEGSGIDCVSYHSGYIWISSTNYNSVLEYNASNGAYVRRINIPGNPDQLIFTGNYLFVVSGNATQCPVNEYQNGVFVKTVARLNGFNGAERVTMLYDGTNLWVASSVGNTVSRYAI